MLVSPAAAIAYGGDAAAITQMRGNQAGSVLALSLQAGRLAEHETMAGAVKPVSAHAMILVESVGQRIQVGVPGQGLVKGSIKTATCGTSG